MEAYEAAKQSLPLPKAEVGRAKIKPGSAHDIVSRFLASPEFTGLKPSTQNTYRRILERFRQKHGDNLMGLMEPRNVRYLLQDLASTPTAANRLLQLLRQLFDFAIAEGLLHANPTTGVKRLPHKGTGFHTWTEDEIEQFESAWPQGTRERLAFDLALYTGQRRSDLVRLGWQHVARGVLFVKQEKTGAELEIPIDPDLVVALSHAPRTNMTFLVTAKGAPFTPQGLTNWFAEVCKAAGLPKGRSVHGLRLACARRLAEAGCSPNEIGAITGHRTLKEIQRYTRAAEQSRLAVQAKARQRRAKGEQELANPAKRVAKSTPNPLKGKE